MNSNYSLEETILDSELRHINFFNGRLLTGGDLQAEQSVEHAHARHLGSALGSGVACGLTVTKAADSTATSPIVVVSPGLAVNRAGQTLRLKDPQRVALTKSPDQALLDQCIFTDCGDPASTGATLASSPAYYVMMLAPASLAEGKAPVSGLGNGIATCNSAYNSEGVKFRLLKLNVSPGTDAKKVRNLVAYRCFGVPGLTSNDFVQNALTQTPVPNYGVEALVPTGYLTTSDVPLAIIEWNPTGLGFVDQWSVRRRLTKSCANTFWEPLIGDRGLAEGEAMFLQFQDQIADMLDSKLLLSQVAANEQFAYLPPVGFLPLDAGTQGTGVDYKTFFGQMTYREPIFIEGAQLRSLVSEAVNYPPIDTKGTIVVWLYLIRENAQAVLGSANPQQSYIVFATGDTWYRGDRIPVLLERSPAGDVEVNSRLTLIGRNFLMPSEENTVILGGIPINQFDGDSDESNLIFTVPNVFSGLPRSVPVSVSNRFGKSAELQVGLLPTAQQQGGQVVIFNQTAPLGQINEGQTYDLGWLVDSQTNLPATYAFGLIFSNVVGASVNAWQTNSQIVPTEPTEISRGSPLLVTAQVTVPDGATSAQVALKAESIDHSFSRTSDSIDFTVGQTTVVSDPRVLLTLDSDSIGPFDDEGNPNSVRAAIIDGVDGVEVKFGGTGTIPIKMHVTSDLSAEGIYHFEATVENPDGLWTASSATVDRSLNAPSDSTITAEIQNQETGASNKKFMVISAVHMIETTEDFTSFVRFPIRGATF